MLKVAILGFGFIGKAHGEAYAQLPNVRLVGIGGCSKRRVDEWKAPYPVPFYSSVDELLQSSGANIVDICLPTFLHEEFVIQAAERGLHVICEKPLALTVPEVDRMLAAVDKAGITFMVAQVLRFFPHYTKCRELVRKGQLGDVIAASASRLSQFPPWGQWFRDPAKSGGALFDLQVHDLDYLLDLFGMPDCIFASGLRSATGSWDHVINLLSYPNRQISIEASYLMPPSRPFTSALRLVGTKGSIEYEFRVTGNVDSIDRAQHTLTLYPGDGSAADIDVDDADAYLAELKYFVDCVESARKPAFVSPEDARNVIAVLEAAKHSLEAGNVVELQRVLAKD